MMMKLSLMAAVVVGAAILATIVSAKQDGTFSLINAGSLPLPGSQSLSSAHLDRRKRQACGTPTDLTAAQQAESVNLHNKYRSLEPSSNEFQVSWNVDLAAQAQAYSSQCTWAHGMQTDCSGNTIGQNMYMTWGSSIPPLNMTDAITDWWNERQYWDFSTQTCQAGETCGHYTQLVWATSTLIGCGYSKCPTVTMSDGSVTNNGLLVVCNYSPTGNWYDEVPYTTGSSCSNCASITQSTSSGVNYGPGFTCNANSLCSPCNPATNSACQCGPASECSGNGVWKSSTCSCSCDAGYFGDACENVCEDAAGSDACGQWQPMGFCGNQDYHDFMLANCAQTCGMCD